MKRTDLVELGLRKVTSRPHCRSTTGDSDRQQKELTTFSPLRGRIARVKLTRRNAWQRSMQGNGHCNPNRWVHAAKVFLSVFTVVLLFRPETCIDCTDIEPARSFYPDPHPFASFRPDFHTIIQTFCWFAMTEINLLQTTM